MRDALKQFAKTVRRSVKWQDEVRMGSGARRVANDIPLEFYAPDEVGALYDSVRESLLTSLCTSNSSGTSNPIRVEEYIRAQPFQEAQDTVRKLLSGGRGWRYISLQDFAREVERVTKMLVDALYVAADKEHATEPTAVVFVLDSYTKSSFWVFMQLYHVLMNPRSPRARARYSRLLERLYVVIDSREFSTRRAFQLLPEDSVMCFVDDAAYTALQMKTFHKRMRSLWDSSKRGNRSHHLDHGYSVAVAPTSNSSPPPPPLTWKAVKLLVPDKYLSPSRDREAQMQRHGVCAVHHRPSRSIVILPFVSTWARHSLERLKQHDHGHNVTILNSVTLRSLFDRRTTQWILENDLFYALPVDNIRHNPYEKKKIASTGVTIYPSGVHLGPAVGDYRRATSNSSEATFHSFLFDRLHLDYSHSAFVFEHKIPDAVSIPFVWLHLGPCVQEQTLTAYRVKRGSRARELLEYLEEDEGGTIDARAASIRVQELMQSQKFREHYLREVRLTRAPPVRRPGIFGIATPSIKRKRVSAMYPLVSPKRCGPIYQTHIEHVLKEAAQNAKHGLIHDIDPRWLYHLPECTVPPYRKRGFASSVDRIVIK